MPISPKVKSHNDIVYTDEWTAMVVSRYGSPLTKDEAKQIAARIAQLLDRHGLHDET